ncbi:hypothetical protein SAMN05920897_104161 [Alkalispirochaeta americana]|uniref:WD40-like Beta Propeller Repeat n=1 Tax=Alkalispirochaeta americana TaxID=159291 RepID=A0A1N6QGB8_9SPIO|nr:hypothetical protein [Alkalispirochaeta americana]SIQ15651.1 hypothetical protein SAMN05920897_104161 [Alkalispirochaeta americana]
MKGIVLFFLFLPLIQLSAGPAQFRWHQVETDQFRIIFQEKDRPAAEEVLSLADEVYRKTSSYMDYRPSERVPVVIYGDTAQANGFFTPFPGHIALFVASPAGPWMGARTENWLETLFIHELIHYLHLTRPVGFFGFPSRLFGPLLASASMIFSPGWAIEGVTVYGESALAPGGRGDNPFFKMQALAPILEDRMYTYDQAAFNHPAYAPRGRIYTAGYLMVDYLMETYGDDIFVRLNRSFQRAPFLGMRRAIRRTTGVKAPDLYQSMVDDLRNRYDHRRDLPRGEELSPAGPGHWDLPVPTERGLVTWGNHFDRGPGLYVQKALHEPWRLLARTEVAPGESWTVDSRGTLAVVATITTDPYRPGIPPATGVAYSDLFLLDLSARCESRDWFQPPPSRRITHRKRLYHPALSPDGSRLVAIERQGSFSRLVSVDIASGSITPLVEAPKEVLRNPAFSPDGSLLALTANYRGQQRLLVVAYPSGEILEDRMIFSRAPDAAVYYPRFHQPFHQPSEDAASRESLPPKAPPLEIWYGGDAEGFLSLYRSVLSDQGLTPPQRMLRDQVGAWGGFPLPASGEPSMSREATSEETGILYGSYSSDGQNLKLGESRAEEPAETLPPKNTFSPVTRADADVGAGADANQDQGRGSHRERATIPASPRPYRDTLRPLLWTPLASAQRGGDQGDSLDLGVFFLASSNLGRHTLQGYALYNPDEQEPSGGLAYTFSPGVSQWTLETDRQYELDKEDTIIRTTEIAGRASRLLGVRRAPGSVRVLTGEIGLGYQLEEEERPDSTTTTREIEGILGLQYLKTGPGASRDLFGPPKVLLATELSLVPDLLDADPARLESTSLAHFRWQPLRRISGMAGAIQLAPAGYITTSTDGDALGRLPYRSGGFDDRRTTGSRAQPDSADTALLARAEVLLPLRISDAAWRGIGTMGSGLALYLEQGAALSHTRIAPTASSVVGADFTKDVVFNMIPLRLTLGAARRLPHPGSDTSEDWTVYFRLGGTTLEWLESAPWRRSPRR